jgi:flagellar biosynthesis/type III secretory pathway protein FliH
MTVTPALGRQRQVDLYEFEASLVYKVSSRTARVTQRNPVSKNQKKKKEKRKKKGRKEGRKEGRKKGKKEERVLYTLS